MRTTVGPLPPAVYWRRRAMVLGAILLVVFVIVYACTGSPAQHVDAQPTPAPPTATQTPPVEETSAANPFAPVPAPVAGGSAAPGASGANTPCTDDEIVVTARVDRDPVPRGAFLRIFLSIKNVSSRTCTRDIGPDSQEAQVRQAGKRIWSSDDCHPRPGTNVVSLAPNAAGQEFFTDWNTSTSSPGACTGGRTLVPQGTYEAVVRFGGKESAPVTFRVS